MKRIKIIGAGALPARREVQLRTQKGIKSAARRTSVILAVALGAATLTGVHPAQAFPNGCDASMLSALTVNAYCRGGTGEFRAKGFCERALWPDKVVYGPWRPAGGNATSQVSCPIPTRNVQPSMDIRGPA